MNLSPESTFVDLINRNVGIAHKVGRIYFEDPDDRDDVIQEMMYQLWRSFPSYDHRSKFPEYFCEKVNLYTHAVFFIEH